MQIFHDFCIKIVGKLVENMKKLDFHQHLESAAPTRWLKSTTCTDSKLIVIQNDLPGLLPWLIHQHSKC